MNLGEFKKIVNESKSFSEVSRKLYGNNYYGNRQTIKKRILGLDIDISHFDFKPTGSERHRRFIKIPLSEILVSGSTYNTKNLKQRLYDEGLKDRICEKCGQDEWWHGEKMGLILDHINGNNTDNRLENLRILCPNCNSTLPTHGGKNIKHKPKGNLVQQKPMTKEEKREHNKNKSLSQRRVKRPSREQLLKEIEESNYCAVGRKYGVSDNAIRKWVKFYEKY
jgi:hypothetical protein